MTLGDPRRSKKRAEWFCTIYLHPDLPVPYVFGTKLSVAMYQVTRPLVPIVLGIEDEGTFNLHVW